MKIDIRNIKMEDAKHITALSKQLGYKLSESETENNIKKILQAKDNYALVALHQEKIIGWIHAFKAIRIETTSFIEIGGLVVDENYRGLGVGKLLVGKIKGWSLQKGIHDLRVRCNIKRVESHQFYLALGFKQTKEQKVFQINL